MNLVILHRYEGKLAQTTRIIGTAQVGILTHDLRDLNADRV
jgi:hypothetical protein